MADETQLDWDRLERLVLSFNLWTGVILLFILSPFRIFAPLVPLALWMLKRVSLGCSISATVWRVWCGLDKELCLRRWSEHWFRLWFGVFGMVVYGTVIWDISLDTGVRIVFSQSVLNESIEPFWGLTNSWRCWWMDTRGERIIERYILSVPALPYFTEFLAFAGSLM